jgi:hypothetical protein
MLTIDTLLAGPLGARIVSQDVGYKPTPALATVNRHVPSYLFPDDQESPSIPDVLLVL